MYTSTPTYDAIIVGARAAGASTAMLLARAGMRVLVLERSQYGTDTLSTHALMRGGVMQLSRWGLLDEIIDRGTPPIRRTTFTYDNEQVVITIKPSYGVDALYAPRRTVLDAVLVDAAIAAGAEVRYGVTVTGLQRDLNGRVIGVRTRDRRDARGRSFTTTAGIVIGADGMRSTVASAVAAPMERVGTGATAVVYGYWSGIKTDGYEWIYRPNAAAGIIPTNDDEACIFTGATPERVGRGGMDVLLSILADASPEVAARVQDGNAPAGVRTFTGRPGFVRRSWGPGWALVGDAGYWKDPISTHGLTDALRDAELLARAIQSYAGGDATPAAALAGYQATRDRLSAALFDVTDAIASQQWRQDEIPSLLRRLSAAMTDEVEAIAAFDLVAVP